MVNTNSHQHPWINPLIYAETEQMLVRSRQIFVEKALKNGFTECVLAWSPDHGYSREDRLCKRDNGEWYYSIDSHRGNRSEQQAKWQDRVNTLVALIANRVMPLSPGECKLFRTNVRPFSHHISLLFWYNQPTNNLVIINPVDDELEEALMWAFGIDVNERRRLIELQKKIERRSRGNCIYCGCCLDPIRLFVLRKDACQTCEKEPQFFY